MQESLDKESGSHKSYDCHKESYGDICWTGVIVFGLKVILIFLIPFIAISASANYFVFNERVYSEEFEKVGTYERVNDADEMVSEILKFFRGDLDSLDIDDMTVAEKEHMLDVKILISNMKVWFYLSIIIAALSLALLMMLSKNRVKDIIHISAFGGIGVIAITFLVSIFDFGFIFEKFHHIFFPQGNWQFMESSLLIQLFPVQFFMNMSGKIGVAAGMVGVSLLIVSLILYYVTRVK